MEGGGGTKVARRGGGRSEEEEGSILFPPSPFHSPSPPLPLPPHSSSLLRIAARCIAIALHCKRTALQLRRVCIASGHRPWVGPGVRSVSNPWAGARLCDSL